MFVRIFVMQFVYFVPVEIKFGGKVIGININHVSYVTILHLKCNLLMRLSNYCYHSKDAR